MKKIELNKLQVGKTYTFKIYSTNPDYPKYYYELTGEIKKVDIDHVRVFRRDGSKSSYQIKFNSKYRKIVNVTEVI